MTTAVFRGPSGACPTIAAWRNSARDYGRVMRTYAPRLESRGSRSRVDHDHTFLSAIGCVAAAVLLYMMFTLLWGVVDDDLDALGGCDTGIAIVARAV